MNSRPLDVLHDPRDEDLLAVADGIDFDFPTHEVFVDEHRMIGVSWAAFWM